MKLTPVGNTVLIKPATVADKSKGGILLPEQSREKPQEGTIIALGTGGRDERGNLIPFEVAVGDRVLLSKYGATEVEVDGEKYKLASVEDLLAIIG